MRDLTRETKEAVLESISATGFPVGEASSAAQLRWSWMGSCQGWVCSLESWLAKEAERPDRARVASRGVVMMVG